MFPFRLSVAVRPVLLPATRSLFIGDSRDPLLSAKDAMRVEAFGVELAPPTGPEQRASPAKEGHAGRHGRPPSLGGRLWRTTGGETHLEVEAKTHDRGGGPGGGGANRPRPRG